MASLKEREPQVLVGDLVSHPAFVAWQQLTGESLPPSRIDSFQDEETVRKGRKPLVFRLHGVFGGKSMIAKKSRSSSIAAEVQIYTELLPRIPVTSVRCMGTVAAGSAAEHVWTFLEDAGDQHWLKTDHLHRVMAARWMGALHAVGRQLDEVSRLADRGFPHYRKHAEAAESNLRATLGRSDVPPEDRQALEDILLLLDRIGADWSKLEEIADGPSTLVHGDFVRKNVRVQDDDDRLALLAIDWEFAGRATPAADVAEAGLAFDEEAASEYRRVASSFGWAVTATQLRQLATAGSLLRVLSGIYWESRSIGENYRPRFGWRMRSFSKHLEDSAGFLLNGHSEVRQPW